MCPNVVQNSTTMKYIFSILLVFTIFTSTQAQELSALEIITKADEQQRGDYNQGTIKMSIIRPDWTREMTMKTWSNGTDYTAILVTQPARDKGTAFLKREREMWNWQPSIDRVIKMPPSMMSQSWMGSDFTNDDLVKQSSIVVDYTHEITGEATLEDRLCWEITLTPTEEAAVVWGKVISWVDQKDFLQLKTEFYDEDDYLVNTMHGKSIAEMGGRILPTILEVVPADEEGHLTRVEYQKMDFKTPIKKNFFSIQQLKRLR